METREDAIERIIKKLRRSGESVDTFAFEFQLRDRNGSVVDSCAGNSRKISVEEAVEVAERKIKEILEDNPHVYSIAGNSGAIRPIKGRTQFNDIIPIDDEDDIPMPAPLLGVPQTNFVQNRQEVQEQPKSDEDKQNLHMESLDDVFETLNIMGETFGVKGLGDINSLENKKMAFIIQMRDNQLKAQAKEREHLGTIETQKEKITEQSAEIKMLKDRLEKLEKDNEAMKKRIEKNKPQLEDYKRMQRKNERISTVVGQAFGHVLAGFASHTKYASLLGILDEPEEQNDDEQDDNLEEPGRVEEVTEVNEINNVE